MFEFTETVYNGEAPTLTLEKVRAAIHDAMALPPGLVTSGPRDTASQLMAGQQIGSMGIIYSPHALETTAERLFPESRHRSRRIHKKLVKRHGGEYRMRPTIWRTPMGIIAHPNFKPRLEAAIAAQR